MNKNEIEVHSSMVLDDADGIECDTDVTFTVRIDHYTCVKGDSTTWDSDADYYGYEEIDFTVVACHECETDKPVFPFVVSKKDEKKIKEAISEYYQE